MVVELARSEAQGGGQRATEQVEVTHVGEGSGAAWGD